LKGFLAGKPGTKEVLVEVSFSICGMDDSLTRQIFGDDA
jgi:hypothetical protein